MGRTAEEDKARITERFLAGVWQRQLVKKEALLTREGRRVEVIQPGRENCDSGPDFRDALVVIEGAGLLRGDVEIHVRARDWHAHAHHRDPSYNGVVLHVVWWDQGKEKDSPLENGERAVILPLCRSLQRPVEELRAVVQSRQLFPQPCSDALGRLGGEVIARVLEKAGDERFLLKAKQFEGELAIGEAGQVLYEGFMSALGYAKNKEPFRELARKLPLSSLKELIRDKTRSGYLLDLQALLLGTAGLLPGQRGKEDRERWVGALERRWQSLGRDQGMREGRWRFFRVRPENFPTRRIAAASYLLAGYGEGFFPGMMMAIRQIPSDQCGRILEQGLVVSVRGYWAGHFDFARGVKWSPTLLGRGRAAEIVVNIVLPFFCAWAGVFSHPTLKARVVTLYRQYRRLEENWITRYMGDQIFQHRRPKLIDSARRQQGLLHLYKTFCTEWKCEQCPLSPGMDKTAGGFLSMPSSVSEIQPSQPRLRVEEMSRSQPSTLPAWKRK